MTARRLLVLLALVALPGGPALAQSTTTVVLTPLSAPRPPDSPENRDFFRNGAAVRLGPFFAIPLVQATLGFDDNVFSQNRPRRADGVIRIGPAIIAQTTWSRHMIQAEAAVEGVKYASFNRLDTVNARAGVIGRLDIRGESHLQFTGSYQRTNDLPTDQGFTSGVFGVPLAQLAPTQTERSSSGLLLTLREGRFESQSRIEWQRTSSQPQVGSRAGGSAFDAYTLTQRLGYRIGEGRTAYVEASGNQRRSDVAFGDSQGFRVLTGFSGELTRLLNGELAVGVLRQTYDGGRAQTTLAFSGSLLWRPTQLTSVTLLARRDVGEAGGVANTQGSFAGSGTLTSALLGADHILSRAWVAQGLLRYDRLDRATTGQGSVSLYSFQIGTTYAINRQLSAIALYRLLVRDGDGADNSFTRNQVLIGLRGTL